MTADRLGAAATSEPVVDAGTFANGRPRVAPGRLGQVGLGPWIVARLAGRVTGTEPPALFLVLGRHRKLFWGWLHFAGRLMPGGRLGRADTELVILRVAQLCGSQYELAQHRRLARSAGLEGTEIDRLVAGDPVPGKWTPRRQAILAAVEALHRERDIDDLTWAALRRHVDELEAIELCQLVGHYEMLATTLRALRVPPDRPSKHPRRVRPVPARAAAGRTLPNKARQIMREVGQVLERFTRACPELVEEDLYCPPVKQPQDAHRGGVSLA